MSVRTSPRDQLFALVVRHCNIQLSNQRIGHLIREIGRKDRKIDLELAVEQLCQLKELPDWLLNAATVNETFFFRHPEHFDGVAKLLAGRRGTIEVFCAGVASGEEVWSLAMVATKVAPLAKLKVTGVDLSPAVIEMGRAGVYPVASLARIPESYRALANRYLKVRAVGRRAEQVEVSAVIRNKVSFVQGNIFDVELGTYDLAFCRNMMIYFSPADRRKLVHRIAGSLRPGGQLYIGGGEVFPKPLPPNTKSSKGCIEVGGTRK